MKRIFLSMAMLALFCLPAYAQKDENNRIKNAGKVMVEILNVPDDIPEDLMAKAECVIVLPSVLKFAIGFGGSYGRGVMTCRSGKDFSGPWSAPSMMALEGGSFGLQLGGQATDFVLLVMNRRGADSILTSQVKLDGCHNAGGNLVVFARERIVRRDFPGRINSPSRQRWQREALRKGNHGEGRHNQ
jgi:SH3 domain-containing YSC84-like protein 1